MTFLIFFFGLATNALNVRNNNNNNKIHHEDLTDRAGNHSIPSSNIYAVTNLIRGKSRGTADSANILFAESAVPLLFPHIKLAT